MKSSIEQIKKRIQHWSPEEYYEPNDMLEIRQILKELAEHLQSVESTAHHANNTASCLANGIQPD